MEFKCILRLVAEMKMPKYPRIAIFEGTSYYVMVIFMSKQVGNYFWTKIKENYHISDSKFSSSHSEKVFSYTWLLSNSLDQSGYQQHHTTRPIKFLLDASFRLLLNVEHWSFKKFQFFRSNQKSKM
jgi:hypothetical protein